MTGMMVMKMRLLTGSALLCAMMAGQALAQDVVMRRPIPKSQSVQGGASWRTTPWVIQDASGNPVDAGEACGDYAERRTASCVNGAGDPVDELFCRGQAKPALERQARHDAGCTYAWRTGEFVDPGDNCSLNELQTRDVVCRRDQDSVTMADALCSGAKPAATRTVEDFSTCSHSWVPGAFVDPGASCTDAERQTRPVDCVRDLDGVRVAEGMCNASTKPSMTQDVRDISACTYSWKTGDFVDPGVSCTRAEIQTRTVTCHRSLNDELVEDSACTASKPSSTQSVEDYAGCSFQAVQWSAWTPSSTCSATATKTRTAKCQRSNDGGEIVDDAQCAAAGVALTETVSEANYSTCSNSWAQSGFADPGPNCGNETWTQSVTCRRDLDQALMPDAACSGAKPASTDVRYDTSSCGYAAYNWTAWSWNSQCSANATRTRTAQCRRSDGEIVANSECTNRGVALSESVTEANYDQCSYSASNTQTSCSNGSQTVNWTCTRNQTGQQVAQSFCGTPAQSTQSCSSYSWQTGGFGGFGACQPDSRQYQYRDVYCEQNNGGARSRVDDGFCGGAGARPSGQNSQACTYYTYRWVEGGYSDWSTHCGSATRSQAVWCYRNPDNAYMADQTACYNTAGTKPDWQQSAYVIDGCGYTAQYGGWSACSGGQQSRGMTACVRGDGAHVDGSECANRGQPYTQYQGCSTAYNGEGQCTGGYYIGEYNSYYYPYSGGGYSTRSGNYPASYNNSQFGNWCYSQGGTCWDEAQIQYVENQGTRYESRYNMRCYGGNTSIATGYNYDYSDEYTSNTGSYAAHKP